MKFSPSKGSSKHVEQETHRASASCVSTLSCCRSYSVCGLFFWQRPPSFFTPTAQEKPLFLLQHQEKGHKVVGVRRRRWLRVR